MVRMAKKRRLQRQASERDEATCFIDPNPDELDSFFSNLRTLYLNKQLCDVSFKIGNQLYLAHKVVLASANNFLGAMILSGMQESDQSIIELYDVEAHLFKYILDYIYGVRIELISSEVVPLLGLANHYSMIGLREKLGEILWKNLTVTNSCSIYAAADAYNCESLKKHAQDLIFTNFALTSKSTGFFELSFPLVEAILSSDEILDCDESLIFDATVRWIENCKDKERVHSPSSSSAASNTINTNVNASINSATTPVTNRNINNATTNNSNNNNATGFDYGYLLKVVRFPLMDSCLLSDVIKHHYLMHAPDRMCLLLEAFEYHALRAAGRDGSQIIEKNKLGYNSANNNTANSMLNQTRNKNNMSSSDNSANNNSLASGANSRMKSRKQSCSFTESTLLNGHQDAVSALVVHGEWLISGSWDSSIKVWTTDNWVCVRTLSDHAGAVRGLCVCHDKIVSCSDDGVIMVWSPGSWTCARTLVGADDGAVNAVVECRGRLASAGDDGAIKLWSSSTWGCEVTVHHTAYDEYGNEASEGQIVGVMSLEVCEDKLISGGDDSVLRVWNTNSWTCERIIRSHRDEVWAICITPIYGSLITGSVDSTIRVWHQSITASANNNSSSNSLNLLDDSLNNSLENAADGSHSSNIHHSQHSSNGLGNSGLTRSHSHTNLLTSTASTTASNGNDRDRAGSNLSEDGAFDGEGGDVDWMCCQTIQSDGPVYALCCLDGLVVSAGSSSKISVWRSSRVTAGTGMGMSSTNGLSGVTTIGGTSGAGGIGGGAYNNNGNNTEGESLSLYKTFDTQAAGVWSLTVCRNRLISGGADGTIRVWT